MSGRGRPRKSIEQHIAEATFKPSRHAIPPAVETQPGGDAVVKPEGLLPKASYLWDLVTNRYGLKDTDGPELEACCRWYALALRAMDEFEKSNSGTKRAKLFRTEAVDCWKRFENVAGKFGLSPSERAKLGIRSSQPAGGGVKCRLHA